MKKLFLFVVVAFLIAACAATPASAVRKTAAPPVQDPFPLYPFWTIALMPDGPKQNHDPGAPERLPRPAGSAVLVSEGFLLTSIEGMGIVTDDPGADPGVFVYDGTSWHRGRYVDRDHRLRLALIRADVPGHPVALAADKAKPATQVAIPLLSADHGTMLRARGPVLKCDERPSWLRILGEDALGGLTVCGQGKVDELPGGAFLDAKGALAGIQVLPAGSQQRGGPDAAAVRSYLNIYFASWGHEIRPRRKF